jgi:N-sulfoglucosamine sulfohydrolase
MRNIIVLGILPVLATGCQIADNNSYIRPNILLIVSEDHGQHLSCYGDQYIHTPNLDRIASEGILFRNAYVTQSVCSPARASILTGLYVHQHGHLGLATHGYRVVGNVDNIYGLLKEGGYRTGMIGKLHVNPANVFPIDFHPIKDYNFSKQELNRYWEYADTFFRASEEPFFLMVNFPDAHWPLQDQVDGRPENPLSADEVTSFPYVGFCNERIRSVTASYYNCIARLDESIGELMARLYDSGHAENTIVIYLSDHGDQMARGKIDIYEAGTKVPFLVKWPGKIESGKKSDALISIIDIVPTILDAASLTIPGSLPGQSLLTVFRNPDLEFREYLFTERNADNSMLYFPRRAVRDKRYKLIYTLLEDRCNPAAERYINHPDHERIAYTGSPSYEELKHAADSIRRVYYTWLHPPKIKLYDLKQDPWEFDDIASQPEYFQVKKKLLEVLFDWQETTGDPLLCPEKLRMLTLEHDQIANSVGYDNWKYPDYLYGSDK